MQIDKNGAFKIAQQESIEVAKNSNEVGEALLKEGGALEDSDSTPLKFKS